MKMFIAGASGALGAKPPLRVPARKGPMYMKTQASGISSENATLELDWTPRNPIWRTGFTEGWS